jgi:hypothetical protein
MLNPNVQDRTESHCAAKGQAQCHIARNQLREPLLHGLLLLMPVPPIKPVEDIPLLTLLPYRPKGCKQKIAPTSQAAGVGYRQFRFFERHDR